MPEDSKKISSKKHSKSNDPYPKEQRKPKHGRGNSTNNADDAKVSKKEVIVSKEEKPQSTEPGPEFYKGLKRETDDILKISEEAQSKYSKKEISSNWQKYEIPIDSYEDIEEQENMGADYEKLIQAPMSAGSYFQFKHEKSWDSTVTASEYDKYFDINNDVLAMALSSIPFYERNQIDMNIFSENDLMNMNNRATKYKQKYFNDKTFTTAELDAEKRILETLQNRTVSESDKADSKSNTEITVPCKDKKVEIDIDFLNCEINKVKIDKLTVGTKSESDNKHEEAELSIDFLQNKKNEVSNEEFNKQIVNVPATDEDNTNKVIESEEDLEKWLDDFLDK